MRLLALLQDAGSPSARLRFEPFAPQLESLGARIVRATIPPSGPARWRLLASAREFDVVYLQRRLLQPWESALLRARARRLVVDVDDAVWRRDHAPFESWTRRLRVRSLLRRADVVIAGSRALAAELASIGVAAEVVPTPAPSTRSRSREVAPAPTPTLLWIGQPSTWRYMQAIAPAWTTIRAAIPGVRLLAMGSGVDADPVFEGAEHRDWSLASEAAALAAADVGLAPLPDDPWARGKCAARLLTFLSAGLPAVASPVGGQRELAEEVGGVLLARTAGEVADAAIELLRNPGRGRERGAAAAARLARERSVDALGPRFQALLLPRVAGAGELG